MNFLFVLRSASMAVRLHKQCYLSQDLSTKESDKGRLALIQVVALISINNCYVECNLWGGHLFSNTQSLYIQQRLTTITISPLSPNLALLNSFCLLWRVPFLSTADAISPGHRGKCKSGVERTLYVFTASEVCGARTEKQMY